MKKRMKDMEEMQKLRLATRLLKAYLEVMYELDVTQTVAKAKEGSPLKEVVKDWLEVGTQVKDGLVYHYICLTITGKIIKKVVLL